MVDFHDVLHNLVCTGCEMDLFDAIMLQMKRCDSLFQQKG